MESENKHIRGTGRERVYNFIVEFIKKNGYAPSIREICVGTDLSSTSSVYMHLLKLEDLLKQNMCQYEINDIDNIIIILEDGF